MMEASGTNRLASITSASGARAIGYDARGNTLSETRPGGATVAATYDGYGRLLTYARTGDPAQSNAYNGLDERVKATSAGTTHTYVYDPGGRLMGEYAASATAPVAETLWLSPEVANDNAPLSLSNGQPIGGDDGVGGYAPLGVVTGSGSSAALYWVHGNHLGVPIVTTDSSGALASASGYTMVGFPGQTRTLSDIYYNLYRDYDSSLGRYIQADPIGLDGGSNPYLYAANNPIKNVDPWGQAVWALPIGAAIGGEATGAAGLGAFCTTPVGWVVCGGAAAGAIGYGAYKLYKWATAPDCPIFYTKGKAPENAWDPDGPKAPGHPGDHPDFVPPKKHQPEWGKSPNGPESGWNAGDGSVWVPTGPGGPDGAPDAHGGPHWDQQFPGGGYANRKPPK